MTNNSKVRNLQGKGEFDYDYSEDMLFFKLKNRDYEKSIELHRFSIDIDKENFIVGVQIFGASDFFGMSKEQLRNVKKWSFQASTDGKRLEIRLVFQTVFRNKIIEPRPIIIEEMKEPLPDSKVVCIMP